MQTVSCGTLLDLWEGGRSSLPSTRALLLLRGLDAGEPASWSMGYRDAALLRLREVLFGGRLDCVTRCPHCGARLETALTIADFEAGMPEEAEPPQSEIESHGYRVRFRCLAAGEAARIETVGDVSAIMEAILSACVIEAAAGDALVPAAALPAAVVADLSAAMADADPFARATIAFTCPDCADGWSDALDVPDFLWREIDGWALRTMADVHALASAYGWSEQECLAVPPHRRALYLAMVRP